MDKNDIFHNTRTFECDILFIQYEKHQFLGTYFKLKICIFFFFNINNYELCWHCVGNVQCPNNADITAGWPVFVPNLFESQLKETLKKKKKNILQLIITLHHIIHNIHKYIIYYIHRSVEKKKTDMILIIDGYCCRWEIKKVEYTREI